MTLSRNAFLVIGLLLTSAEAWAQEGTVVPLDDSGTLHRTPAGLQPASLGARARAVGAMPHGMLPPMPPRVRHPGDDHIQSTQGKGPVDVLSLSLGTALACFFLVALVRRRKSARFAMSSPEPGLPQARVLTPGLRNGHDPK